MHAYKNKIEIYFRNSLYTKKDICLSYISAVIGNSPKLSGVIHVLTLMSDTYK